MLAAIRQRREQVPDARAHPRPLGVQVEVPLITSESKLIASGRRLRRRGIDRSVAGGLVAIFDGLERMDAGEHRRTVAGRFEFHWDGALEFKRLQRAGKTAATCVGAADGIEEAGELEGGG